MDNKEHSSDLYEKPTHIKTDSEDDVIAIVTRFFSSLKLAITLFVLLAISSILGTVVEQGKTKDVYIKWIDAFAGGYGAKLYPALDLLGLNDLYHTWWYTALLLLLTVNATTCFMKRSPKVWRMARKEKIYTTIGFIKGLKNYAHHMFSNSEEGRGNSKTQTALDISRILSGRHYKVKTLEREGEVSIFATKGILGRFGAHIAHISIIFIMLGGILGAWFEQKNFGAFLEGETYYVKEGDFKIRVDRFWMDYYENGNVKDFYSKLVVIDDGKEVMTKQIEVNDPLQYKGVWLYQSSYGDSWNRVINAKVQILDSKTGSVVDEVSLDWRKEYKIPDLGVTLRLEQFVSDFAYDPKKEMVYASSADHKNPAIGLVATEDGKESISPWIFYNYPNLYDKFEGRKYKYVLIGYTPHKYTGLQIAKDPGVPFVWTGFGLMTLGMFIASFIFHRRIWIKIRPAEENGFSVDVGGNTNKNVFDFQREIDVINQKIESLKQI